MQTRVPPADMLLFADVVREASFTAAAQAHGVSKQAVSERVSRLEATLGVRLLNRTTRRLSTTDAGERYYQYCAQIAQQVSDANAAMQSEQEEPSGLLRVSAPMLYGRDQLIPTLHDYSRRYPKVQVELRLADKLVNLVEDGIDVALRVSQIDDGTLSVRPIGEVAAYFVATPDLRKSIDAVSDADFVRKARAVCLREGEVWNLPDGAKIKPNAMLTVNDLASVARAAAMGLGVARVPGLLCRGLLQRGELQTLFGGAPASRMTVYAVYLSKRQLATKTRAFIDLLVERKADFVELESQAR
jgi:DNA-binding transcriptional LysR family regulator